MRQLLAILLSLIFISSAKAADSTVSAMTAASAFGGTELTYIVQAGADRKGTPAQFATYVYSLMSGDCTVAASVITCTKTNNVAFSALATTIPGTGVATALGVNIGSAGAFVTFNGALGTPSSGTLTNATGLPIAGLTGLGTGVATAMGSNVNTNGGLLTASTAAVASNAIVTGAGSGTALTGTTPGTGVLTALGTNLSAAGGMSSTIASGTSALGTSAIGSAACATTVTTSATNTATTDVIWWGFNGDPTAVTGYVPLTSGMLTVISYPSVNNVNFKVCNNTSASITPGAITLNWRVIR